MTGRIVCQFSCGASSAVDRDEFYYPDSQDAGIAEVIIAKQRNGPIGTCRLVFMGELMRFENRAGMR